MHHSQCSFQGTRQHKAHTASETSTVQKTTHAQKKGQGNAKKIRDTTAPPKTLRQARAYPDAKKWAATHDAELDQLDAMHAIDWKTQTPNNKRREIIPTTMTYRYKHDPDKNTITHKARCSIRGNRMSPHVHYDPDKTVTYMADRTTIRTLFALAASMNMAIEYFDITGAYLHEKYQHKKKVFVWQPPRFDGSYKHQATHGQLKGNLYATPAAANIYSTNLHRHLEKNGYKQARSDMSLFYKHKGQDTILIGISMDDFLPIATDPTLIDDLYRVLKRKYKVKRMGKPTKYLNWTIRYTKEGTYRSQHTSTVWYPSSHKGSATENAHHTSTVYTWTRPQTTRQVETTSPTFVCKVVGEIRYIADITRPDIAFAPTALARALKKPTQRHWNLAQRLTQYLHTTRTEGILMPFANSKRVQIKAYSDADYANDQTSSKSITRMLTMVNNAPVQWLARQQPVVAKSTCEAEYKAAAEATTNTV